MDQSEDREEENPPSKTTLSGEHENQTRDQRTDDELEELLILAAEAAPQEMFELYSRGKPPKYETTGTSEKKSESLCPDGPVSAGSRPESPLESESERESKVDPAELLQRDIIPSSCIDLTQSDCREEPPTYETTETHDKRSRYMYRTQSDCREEPPKYETIETHNKRMEDKLSDMADRMKGCEDAVMRHMKLTENKFSDMADRMKDLEEAMMTQMKLMVDKFSTMTDWMKEREDAMMAHITQMENKLSDMTDRMKEREDANMAHMKLKRDLQEEEGSDSTESEPEPREEPSSHSDSDGKSSCESFKSDGSMYRPAQFKDSGPSALKKKQLEDEESD